MAEYDVVDAEENFYNDYELIQKCLRGLIYESKSIDIEQRAEIIHLTRDSRHREAITEVLQELQAPRQVTDIECIKIIADLMRYLLTVFVHEKNIDFELLRAMLEASSQIYFVDNKRRTLVTHYVWDHGIWRDIEAWRQCIEVNIKYKVEEVAERIKRRQAHTKSKSLGGQTAVEEKKTGGRFNLFNKGFAAVQSLMKSKETKFDEEVQRNANLIFAELSRYTGFLCNFMVPFEKANELLLNLCLKYGMDKSKMHILLTELMSNQRNIGSMFTRREKTHWSLVKRSERLQQFGHSNISMILGLVIKFIPDDSTLRKIVCLNRALNEILRAETLK